MNFEAWSGWRCVRFYFSLLCLSETPEEMKEDDWMLDCAVDLTASRPPDAPLISLGRVDT